MQLCRSVAYLSASCTHTALDDVLTIVPWHIATVPSDLQAAMQHHMLDVLAQQIVLHNSLPGYTSSTGMDLCRNMGLQILHQILQASGHTLLISWEMNFEVLGSVCWPTVTNLMPLLAPSSSGMGCRLPPPLGYLQEKGYPSLIKIAFQCMMLMCDALAALSPEHLHLCISTLGQFSQQAETNIPLVVVESLFWGVLDAKQAKWCEAIRESVYSALQMHLLLKILGLCADASPEVQMGTIRTLFRMLQLYGGRSCSCCSTHSHHTCGRTCSHPCPHQSQRASLQTQPAQRQQQYRISCGTSLKWSHCS